MQTLKTVLGAVLTVLPIPVKLVLDSGWASGLGIQGLLSLFPHANAGESRCASEVEGLNCKICVDASLFVSKPSQYWMFGFEVDFSAPYSFCMCQ